MFPEIFPKLLQRVFAAVSQNMESTSKKRKTTDADEKKGEPIVLNVGGVKYMTSEEIVKKSPKLQQLCFEEADKQMKDEEGNIFIDRDGELFNFLLKYLRCGKITLPTGFADTDALIEEASHYNLKELKETLEKHKKKQAAVFWVRVVDEQDKVYNFLDYSQKPFTRTVKFPKKINVRCLVGTFLSLKCFQTIKKSETFYLKEIENCRRDDFQNYNYERFGHLSYTFFAEPDLKFFDDVEKEGFEKTSSKNEFITYRYKHSDDVIL